MRPVSAFRAYHASRLCGILLAPKSRSAREPDVVLPLEAMPRVSTPSSPTPAFIFDRSAIFKSSGGSAAGSTPIFELNRVLGRAGNPHVARLLALRNRRGRRRRGWPGQVTEFEANAAEGWANGHGQRSRLFAEGGLMPTKSVATSP